MKTRGNGKDIILQAFHWNLVKTQGTGTLANSPISWYKILLGMANEIADTGATIVYLPPPWRDDSAWESNGKHGGGEGYFWHDFDLNSRYGTKQELAELIAVLHNLGIKAIIDLVTNHRDGARMQADFWPHPGPCWSIGRSDTGGTFMDGRYDMALDCPTVQNRILQAMDELLDDCGVDGWRWDYVWGYAVEDVKSWIKNTRKTEYISIGEYWQSSPNLNNDPMIARYGRDEGTRILGWAKDSEGLAFDIILKRQMQSGNAYNLRFGLNLRNSPDERSSVATFVDNHDMGASPYSSANGWGQQCWPTPPEFKSRGYAFILCMPGTPCIYWPDCFDWGFRDQIKLLSRIRKDARITSSSEWQDLGSQYGGFTALVRNETGEDALIIAIDSSYAGPGKGWHLAAENNGEWRVWLRD